MAGWAGHAGGGTDVRANRIFTGGGGLTERQRVRKEKVEVNTSRSNVIISVLFSLVWSGSVANTGLMIGSFIPPDVVFTVAYLLLGDGV